MKRVKTDSKPCIGKLPPHAIWEVARLLTASAGKHDNEHDNYENVSINEYYDKTMRHLLRWKMGERLDEDGNSNLTAAATDLLILLEKDIYERYIKQLDGRTDSTSLSGDGGKQG